MTSTLVFRSNVGPWSVVTCACGCDTQIVVYDYKLAVLPGEPRFYARHHAPLGADAERTCEPFSGVYEEMEHVTPAMQPIEPEEETPSPFDTFLYDDVS